MTKGLKVKIIISKGKNPILDGDCGVNSKGGDTLTNTKANGLDGLNTENKDDDEPTNYQIDVESDGKFSRKATWRDLSRFTGEEVNSDFLRDWIVQYQEKCFPEGMFSACACAWLRYDSNDGRCRPGSLYDYDRM